MGRWNYFKKEEKSKAMVSIPMAGFSDYEINKKTNVIIKKLNTMGYEVVDSFIEEECRTDIIKSPPIYYLGKSLEKMAEVDLVYFAKGWEAYRGCRIEHEVAKSYGLDILYE